MDEMLPSQHHLDAAAWSFLSFANLDQLFGLPLSSLSSKVSTPYEYSNAQSTLELSSILDWTGLIERVVIYWREKTQISFYEEKHPFILRLPCTSAYEQLCLNQQIGWNLHI